MKNKIYRVSFDGYLDIKAKNETEAHELVANMNNEEIGQAVKNINEIKEIKKYEKN